MKIYKCDVCGKEVIFLFSVIIDNEYVDLCEQCYKYLMKGGEIPNELS